MPQQTVSEIHGPERRRFSVPENQLAALLRARRDETQAGITALDRRGEGCSLSYAQLYEQAARLCAGLQEAGLSPNDRLVLQLSDVLDVIVGFWGCVLAGVVPVPLNTAPFYHRPNSQRDKLVSAIVRFDCRAVLAAPEIAAPLTELLATLQGASCAVLNLANCLAATTTPVFHEPAPDDAGAMFLTSGSTGDAKGVVQSHAAMLAMADATIQMNGFTSDDVTLNWMSLDHAGSLVFLGVMPLALGAQQVHVPIDYVLKEPARWLDLIDTWRASITWAPNFVFSLLLDREEQLRSGQWDLSCMRFMVNAGEAVVSATARRFIALLQRFALPQDALRPAFGMVETCSGITWSPGFRLDDTADADQFVSLGSVIPGAAMKVVDDQGASVAEGQEGRLLLKGASVFKGYEGEAALNAGMLREGWLVTGDLAYIKAGALHVTGREKDMVIINGNNHYCHEIEAVVGRLPEIASDSVAATGVRAPGDNTESLVIFYAITGGESGDRDSLEKHLRADVSRATGIAPRAFVRLLPDEFPRTEIGKIKRSQLKRRYEAGEFQSQASAAVADAARADRAVPEASADSARFKELLSSITDIWRRALKLDVVGLDDTFFELGGSSLLAIQVQHELEGLLEREVSMVELFDTPTIRSMATYFSGGRLVEENLADAGGNKATGGDIAVIGIACRFPGAHGPEAFWRVLEEGVETITFFSPEEAIAAGVPPERAHDPAQVNAAPVLDDVEGCDLDFWKYAKREAELLDPQQRVFLETAWEAFEDAGYVPGAALGRVGVYAAAATNTYLQNNVYANRAWVDGNGGSVLTVDSFDGFNVMVSNDKDYLPTRVSYKLDLTGPSLAVQTACSSTLVAVHEAARAVREGECDMALAGGCALMLPQHAGHYYDEGMINTPDGHCRAYDRDAKGTIFGSGSGAVLLKRLDRALADGDTVYAVIKGSAVVNDGGQKMGFTAPSMMGEYRAISQAIRNAGIDAGSIGFVEGHGTGTPIGDPIEVQALTRAFRHSTDQNGYCALGSVKTNIGHMGIASGIAGFIKTVLALHHKTLPATLHFQEANPAIGIEKTPFFVSNRTRAWDAGPQPRRAGVNSLGIGGTNVHVILEEAPVQPREPREPREQGAYVLPLSASSVEALADRSTALAAYLARHPEAELADLCFTQQRGRLAMACRRALVFANRDELLTLLNTEAPQPLATGRDKPRTVFMFTGQGSQYAGMGRELYATHPVFRDALDACAVLFAPHREHSLRDLILAEADDADANALLSQTLYTQPALFCIQVALVQLWRRFGVQPDLIVGHSIGEVAGVWAAGGLSLSDAATLVEARSRLMQSVTEQGGMASVKAGVEDVLALLRDAGAACEIAASNSPQDTTITGDADAVAGFCTYLQAREIRVTPLTVSHAFHSRHMEAIQAQFAAAIAGLTFKNTTVPVISNLDAAPIAAGSHDAAYWVKQLRAPVSFMQGLQQALALGGNCCVEIGPASVLCGLGRALDSDESVQWVPSLRKGHSDERTFAGALAALFTLGHELDWSASSAFAGRRIPLPTYPWQRQRCWIEPDARRAQAPLVDPLLARPLVLPRLGQQIYSLDYAVDTLPVLEQHRVFGTLVPPGALYVSQLLRTAADVAGRNGLVLSDINFVRPIRLEEGGAKQEVQILYSTGTAATNIEISSQPADLRLSGAADAVQVHVTAELLPEAVVAAAVVDMDALRRRCGAALDPHLIEAHMASMQVGLGESFLCFKQIHRGANEALALLEVPRSEAARIGQGIPAGLIDCHWQTVLAAMPALSAATMVPARIDTLICHGGTLPDQVWAHAVIQQHSDQRIVATVSLLTAAGQLLLESRGIEFRAVEMAAFRHATLPARVFSRHWEPLRATSATGAVDAVAVAGNARDAALLAVQLREAGVEPLLLNDPQTNARLAARKQPLPLLYVDRVETGVESCIALNHFLASLDPSAAAFDQIMVVTALADAPATAFAAAHRSALAVQAMSAAQELPDWIIRVVAMDQEQRSVQALLPLLATATDRGRRLKIKAGLVHGLKAAALEPGATEITFAPEQLQVITGGLGGLGLLTMEWMFQRGARQFLLAGRSAPSAAAEAVLTGLRAQGARIEIQRCDVGRREDVLALAETAGKLAPVETLIHAAGLRQDGLIRSLKDGDFTALAQAKAQAAVSLHDAFRALDPKHTLYYSSIAAWLGAAAQSNYAAANAALDALAGRYAGERGRTLSVAWGPWSNTGMTAALNDSQRARIGDTGYGFLDAATGFNLLGRFLANPVASEITILAGDTAKLATLPGAAEFWPSDARDKPVAAPAQARLPSLVGELLALNDKAASELLQDHLARLVSEMTHRSARDGALDYEAGFLELGIDSLGGLELRKKLENQLGLKLKSTLILDYASIVEMARALALQVHTTHGAGAQRPVNDNAQAKADRAALLKQLANEIDL
jgi:acyl transferase domain-containing protein/acyl-CoA synthetase (AMP-forming)/AMP-acid ligase II/acyl carrier protein